MKKNAINKKDLQGIRWYILIALGWAYTFWIIAAIISTRNPTWPGIQWLHFLGGSSPLLGAIFTVTKLHNWKDYLRRCVNFSEFYPFVWLIILSPVFIGIIASLITGGTIDFSEEFLNQGLFYAIFLFFFGPLPEELGWRGVLFDLSRKQSFLKAQLLTAIVWFTWHLPLFFIVGTYQHGVGIGSSDFIFWGVGLVIQSIIMGYLYVISNRSIATAILFHYFVNLAGEALEKTMLSELVTLAFYAILVLVLGFAYKNKLDVRK